MVIALLAACRAPTPDGPPPPTHSGGGTTATHSAGPDPDAERLDCTLAPDHALRGCCVVTWEAEDAVELVFSADGEDPRSFRADAPALVHEVPFWGLVPDTRWTVTARAPSTGEVREVTLASGPLPDDFDRLRIDVTDRGGSTVSAVLATPVCPAFHVVAFDRRGRVVWYQDTTPEVFVGDVDAFSLTDRGTVLVTLGRERIREFAFDGTLVRELVRGRDFTDVVHHDVIGVDGLTFALAARRVTHRGQDWVADSVLAWDEQGRLLAELDTDGLFPYVAASWMSEGYWAGSFPGALDLSHANAVSRDADGDLWVSFRHQFAVARFAGDPRDPAFGTLRSLVVGDPESPSVDLATGGVTGGPRAGFTGQHDAHRGAGDTVLLLDNGWMRNRPAEASRYDWDRATDTWTWREGWDVARSCPTMGGARELPGGHVLATCATQALVREFAPGAPGAVWDATLSCGGQPSIFAEGTPLALPTGQ